MWQIFKNGQGSVILRTKIRKLSTGNGFTGLAFNTSGLIISTIADNEATPTVYPVATSKVEAVNALGFWSAPTATKCRFSKVDDTNHPGLVELQLDNARFTVLNAKSLWVSISGVTDMLEQDGNIPLWVIDPYDPNVIADKVLYRDMTATKTAMGGEPPRYSVMNAMRTGVCKRDTTTLAGSLTIMQENGTTPAFQQTIVANSSAQLITSIG